LFDNHNADKKIDNKLLLQTKQALATMLKNSNTIVFPKYPVQKDNETQADFGKRLTKWNDTVDNIFGANEHYALRPVVGASGLDKELIKWLLEGQ
jgi:hypothetical protein